MRILTKALAIFARAFLLTSPPLKEEGVGGGVVGACLNLPWKAYYYPPPLRPPPVGGGEVKRCFGGHLLQQSDVAWLWCKTVLSVLIE